ncbi:hypothetical protein [Scytonema millei]|nr:hypothetical protein [Scytonema millei]
MTDVSARAHGCPYRNMTQGARLPLQKHDPGRTAAPTEYLGF